MRFIWWIINLYCQKDQINAYKDCINRILDDFESGKLQQKLKKGKKYVKENLLESQVFEKTISVYKNLEEINYKKIEK